MGTPPPKLSAALLVWLAVSPANALEPRDTSREEHDALGRVTRRADGERVIYPAEPVRRTPPALRAKARGEGPVGPSGTLDVTEEWRRSIFGYGIGLSGLHVVDLDADGDREIVAAAGDSSADRFWYVLSPTPTGFEHTYISDELPGEIHSLLVQQLDADPALEVVIGTGGRVVVIDGATHQEQFSWSSPAEEVRSLTLADVDGDAQLEAVFCDSSFDGGLYVYDFATGTQEFRAVEFRCDGLAVGNVDADPGPEIVVASTFEPGLVLDGATRLVEWTYLPGVGPRVVLANQDADPWSEIVAAGVWRHLPILDAVLQQEVASITTALDVAAVEVLDVEGDGPLEIVYGDGQWGGIHVHDAQSLALKWSVANPDHGITDIAFGNLDADPAKELVWGAGYSDTGPDHLYVVDTASQVTQWQSLDFAGPFYALSHGDVDADGQPELLYGSFESHSGPGDGVWFVHDARTKALEFVSTPSGTNWTGLWRIRNANVDADPQQEIFVTTSDIYDGIIICYDGVTHAEQWRATLPNGLSFQSVQLGNVDADPALELVASVDVAHSGAPGVFVYVYDAGTGSLEWQSPDLAPGLFKSMALLRLGNVDGDPNVEIVVGALHDEIWIIDGVTHQVTNLGDQDVTALDLADRDGNGTAELIVGTERIIGPERVGPETGKVRVIDTSGTVVETVASYPDDIDALVVQDVTGDGVFDCVLAVDEHVFVRDGATGAERWNSGRLRHASDGVGELDSLLLADVDVDGRRELVVNLSRIGLRVFELPAPGDVALFVTDAPDPALPGGNVTYTFQVQNQTSTLVTSVTLAVALPSGATFVSSTPGAPTCTPSAGTLSCVLGGLAGGAGSTVEVVVSPLAPGLFSTSGTVASSPSDPTPGNNTATATTRVTAALEADLALTMHDDVT
ncbi:MAG TPA: DUF11 domain-containing protein, partial [Vicinamibacteria bacterium]|nr:DUF11 domain-containing protein [Vicinamibacteria bacterium]